MSAPYTTNLFEPHPAPATIPHGVADYFWTEAADRRRLAEALLRLFRAWGYGDVILPAFEYASTLARGASEEFQRDLYRFSDRDGSALALRADMTIAVARLVATRLHDVPMPQRFCYADSVFRYARTQAGRQREFFQAGIELVGAASAAADAEVLALAAHALDVAGLANTRIALGHLGYFQALMEHLTLTPATAALLIRAIDSNSDAELAAFLQQTALSDAQKRTVARLAHLSGDDPGAVLQEARALALNAGMTAALDNLAAILAAVESHALANPIFVDLTEIHNLGYYTGITFEVLAPGLGFAVASGGRYDNLVGSFGAAQPAVGAAFLIDSILLARRVQRGAPAAAPTLPQPIAPHAVVQTHGSEVAQAIVNRWRAQGAHIVVALDDRAPISSLASRPLPLPPPTFEWSTPGFVAVEAGEGRLLTPEQVWQQIQGHKEAPNWEAPHRDAPHRDAPHRDAPYGGEPA